MKMADDEIKAIVAETLTEQHRLQQESIDAIVLKAVASVLGLFRNRRSIFSTYGDGERAWSRHRVTPLRR